MVSNQCVKIVLAMQVKYHSKKVGVVIYLLSGPWFKLRGLTNKVLSRVRAYGQAKRLRLGLTFSKESKGHEA